MARDEAYQIAEQKIEEARRSGAKELDLSCGYTDKEPKLTELPDSLGQLTQLRRLDLFDNQLTALPESLGQLTQLQELRLANNRLTALPESLGQLVQLRVIIAYSNKFVTLPEWLGNLSRLETLHLGNNPLNALPPMLGNLNQLRRLNVDFSHRLDMLPDALGRLAKLEYLDASRNRLVALPDSLGHLTQLQSLRLDGNKLTTLPESLGQLTQLQSLTIDKNQLTALPEWLGNLTNLRELTVKDNPLPSELQRLGGEEKLIGYLRELAVARKKSPDADAIQPFNEAKLLLVGPGEVGKTWLLQALQGSVPKNKGSTKGIEISREPLDLPHPAAAGRIIHLNCWDFGGQEQYQITHQIFFSAKAIYLLVWKPRVGFDPELAARLERIELSAGKSAKVFVVSTHADGNVPPIIGEQALRERFGELIQGFYAVDTKRGPEGAGMAQLKTDIAKAASQLEGIDTPFPSTWRAAKAAVCARAKKSTKALRYSEFVEICRSQDLKSESCESLAIVMHDLGNIVFFREAAASSDAEMKQGDNLVVLDPEWLAKAVAFVIEDQEARKHYGVLEHKRLKTIWAKDSKRKCPGYGRNLFGYLLWMMWKFDIAYKQNEHTSLVPELIQRNRPDDLRWTPLVKPQERQAALILRMTQNPPQGLIPVLTAAVHPLRRIQDPSAVSDTLDRNWREGFFIDTAHRGSAFVELEDRDLYIVTRDNYPADLVKLIRKTLERIIRDRWPRLPIDYHVRCIMRTDKGEQCRGTFKWDYLVCCP